MFSFIKKKLSNFSEYFLIFYPSSKMAYLANKIIKEEILIHDLESQRDSIFFTNLQ